MTFGSKLIQLRKSKNLSLEQLSYELNLSKSAVAKWEADECKPSLDNLLKICDFYQIDIYTLLKEVSNIDFSHATFEGSNYVVNPTNTNITYNTTPEDIVKLVAQLAEENKSLKQEISFLREQLSKP